MSPASLLHRSILRYTCDRPLLGCKHSSWGHHLIYHPMTNTSTARQTHRGKALQVSHAFFNGPVLEYSNKRNFDFGYSENRHVSRLSKYVSHRILSEYELIRSTLDKHEHHKVEKFIQEIDSVSQNYKTNKNPLILLYDEWYLICKKETGRRVRLPALP